MHRLLFVIFAAVAVSALEKDEFFIHCGKIFNTRDCCMDKIKFPEELVSILKECSQMPGPPACDQDICVATKNGYGTADGKIDLDKALKHAETVLVDQPMILASIKAHCSNPDLFKLGPADCQPKVLRHCMQLQGLLQCSSLSDDSSCATMKANVNDCATFLKSMI